MSVTIQHLISVDIAGFALASWRNVRFRLDPKGAEFLDKLIYDVLGFAEISKVVGKYRSISEHATLADALHMFNAPLARHFTHTHRLAVLDNRGRLTNLLSQSDLVRFAWDNIELLDNKDAPVGELQVFRSPVVVEIDTPFYEALTLLYQNRIGGLGLVDNEWRLVGCFSASDLRGVGENLFDFFDSSVLAFMSRATDSTLKAPVTIPLNAKVMLVGQSYSNFDC
jgi:CBS domain-containing protein